MIGQTISHYKILEKLGEGGMGVVYKAQDTKLDRLVALKFLPQNITPTEAEKNRFIHEAKAASALDHPNICNVHEVDETPDGQVFIVMAIYEGTPLSKKIEKGPLGIDEAVDVAVQAAEGLQAAHEKGIVHRDVKSSNIMVTDKGRAVIMDFGLARTSMGTKLTKTGSALGTVPYMSPEQARGEKVDHRTDVWSLGVVLYEMIAGRLPFQSAYSEAVVYSILNENPPSLVSLRSDVPIELEKVIAKALAKNSDKRFLSMHELIENLKGVGTELVSGRDRKVMISLRLPRRTRRYIYGIITSLAGIAVVLGVLKISEDSNKQPSLSETVDRRIDVAVTYFDNVTGDPQLKWLSRGIPDMLINELGESEYLRVVSVEKLLEILHDINKDPSSLNDRSVATEIASKAGAEVMVTGSIIKSGNMLRILAQVNRLDPDGLIKAEKVEGTNVQNVIQMVDELSSKIRVALEIKASGKSEFAEGISRTKTTSVEAYKYYIMGIEALNRAYYDEAITNLRKAIEIDSTFAHAYAALTNVYDVLGELPLAEEAIQKGIAFSIKLPEVDQLQILLRSAQLKGAWNEELEYAKKLVILQPAEPNWHFYLGWHYGTHKRAYDLSISEYQRAIQVDSVGEPRFYYYLGYTYLNAAMPDEAIKAFKRFVMLRPQDANAHDALGAAYVVTGEYEGARQELDAALRLKPDFSRTLANLGDLHLANGRISEAQKYYQMYLMRALGKAQEKDAHYFLGKLYFEENNVQKAAEEIRKSLAIDSKMIEAHWILGLIKLASGDLDSASYIAATIENVLNSSQSRYREEFYHHLEGKIFQKKGSFDRAIGEYRKALQLGPMDRALFLNALGECYAAKGDLDSAIATYTSVFVMNPFHARSHYVLAQIYEMKTLLSAAIEEYHKFLEIWKFADEKHPSFRMAKNRLATLKSAQ